MKSITAIVTYEGNVLSKIKECGTLCPARLVGENTEQYVRAFCGRGFAHLSELEFSKQVEPFVRADAASNGNVLSVRWIFSNIDTKPEPA